MVVFITLGSEFDPTKTLKMQVYTGNSTYEIVGGGASDGGTFEFVTVSGQVECHFRSNIRKTVVAVFRSSSWGMVNPPPTPWTNTKKIESGTYIKVTGDTSSIWWIIDSTD